MSAVGLFAAHRLVSGVKLGLGSTVEWVYLPDAFLRKGVLFSYMKECRSNVGTCTLAMCYPCYCAGLQATAPAHVLDGDWIQDAKEQCGDYIDSYDLKSLAIRYVAEIQYLCESSAGWCRFTHTCLVPVPPPTPTLLQSMSSGCPWPA
jgi:hypothetical protein